MLNLGTVRADYSIPIQYRYIGQKIFSLINLIKMYLIADFWAAPAPGSENSNSGSGYLKSFINFVKIILCQL